MFHVSSVCNNSEEVYTLLEGSWFCTGAGICKAMVQYSDECKDSTADQPDKSAQQTSTKPGGLICSAVLALL